MLIKIVRTLLEDHQKTETPQLQRLRVSKDLDVTHEDPHVRANVLRHTVRTCGPTAQMSYPEINGGST